MRKAMMSAPPMRSTHSTMTLRVRCPEVAPAAGRGARSGTGASVVVTSGSMVAVGNSDGLSGRLTGGAPLPSSSHVRLVALEQAAGGDRAGAGELGRGHHPGLGAEAEQEALEPGPFAHGQHDAP